MAIPRPPTPRQHIYQPPAGAGSLFPPIHLKDPLAPIVSPIVSGVKDSASFFAALTNPDTWVRVGEVLVGTILLVVGIDYMVKADVTGKALKVARLAAE